MVKVHPTKLVKKEHSSVMTDTYINGAFNIRNEVNVM